MTGRSRGEVRYMFAIVVSGVRISNSDAKWLTRKVWLSERCTGNVGIMDISNIFRFLLLFMFVANRARLVVGCVCVNQSKKCFVD